jgi:hypothetical protein
MLQNSFPFLRQCQFKLFQLIIVKKERCNWFERHLQLSFIIWFLQPVAYPDMLS